MPWKTPSVRPRTGNRGELVGLSHADPRGYRYEQEFADRFRGRSVLVTGATGFVGTNLCQALRSIGAQVTGLALPGSLGYAPDPDGVLPVDLSDEASARRAVESIQPEIVFHLAGMVDTRQTSDLVIPTLTHNLLGAVHIMTALVGTRCQRLLVVTSSESPPSGRRPNSPYAASKLAMVMYAEMYFATWGLPVVVARPHLVFGPHQPPEKLIPYLIRCGLDNDPPLLSSGKRLCDPVYIKDFVRALLQMALAEGAIGMTFDVGTGDGMSVAQIATRVLSLLGATAPPVFGVRADRAGEVPQVADLTSTQAVLAWRPIWSFDEALRETIDWYSARRNSHLRDHRGAPREASA